MSSNIIADQVQRDQALDPGHSYIVQAPAGSGKTELLIQRYLKLLARVEKPEEILAITFTRKAASEMRNRVLEALEIASGPEPEKQHARNTWSLARKALKRDNDQNWKLLQMPIRLKIQTIDSLCSSLTRQLPVHSRFGGKAEITDNQEKLYYTAARSAMSHLEQDNESGQAVATLLEHLDNNIPKLEGLLVSMLARRDQWLRHLYRAGDESLQRRELELAIEKVVREALSDVSKYIPPDIVTKLPEFIRFASTNLHDAGVSDHGLLAGLEMQQLPGNSSTEIPQWLAVAELILTKENKPRKRLNKNDGFPPDNREGKVVCKSMKQNLLELISSLHDYPDFLASLTHIRRLPPLTYSDDQWEVMRALFRFLKIAVAELRLVMAELNQVDYIEIAMASQLALGDEDNPTDLAMALDYRISHILIDEFQDTSHVQFDLLRQLSRGWEQGDGRTMFVVGDPMQSIYLFREAEVGLYLKARQEGIGNVRLIPLDLQVNFRSESGIVEWINSVFHQVLPSEEDIGNGAVSYSPSIAFHTGKEEAPVRVHAQLTQDLEDEARRVTELISEAITQEDDSTIAVLVRSRSHLANIIPALKQAKISFQAVDVEPLSECSVIYDLVALTRALLHPADRVSWLSILRAPWCALTLHDLHALAGSERNKTIWELIRTQELVDRCSSDGKRRLANFTGVIEKSLSELRKVPLSTLVQGTWLALGGAATLKSNNQFEQARILFDLLKEFDCGGDILDFSEFDRALEDLYASPDTDASNRVQLMTIHGAKGLEFDHVIIPGLGRRPKVDDSRLMYWLERNHADSESDLLLAPIKGADQKESRIYNYLRSLVNEKGLLEDGRLLYVAATRAKKCLHLLGSCEVVPNSNEIKTPAKSTLLASLWRSNEIRTSFQETVSADTAIKISAVTEPMDFQKPVLNRLPADWTPPLDNINPELPNYAQDILDSSDVAEEAIEFDWATEAARHVGTLVHRYLQRISIDGPSAWNQQRLVKLRNSFKNALLRLGVAENELEPAVMKVSEAISKTLADSKGQWILDKNHLDARSEYALSAVRNHKLVNVIVDRTFIDDEGNRWIIDYKTGTHHGSDVERFLDQEQERYRQQMERYAAVFSDIEQCPIKIGLYFPLLGGWRSWDL